VSTSPLALLALGFGLGLRHALDVDHVAAVTTIVTRERGLGRSSAIGALWGLGHGLTLLVVSIAVIYLRAEIPPGVTRVMEIGVAVMLIVLGTRLLWTLGRGGSLHHHAHAHGGRVHAHPHLHPSHGHGAHDGLPEVRRVRPLRSRHQPLLVGMVHGLAGSGGLMLAVLATVPEPGLALAYVGTFAIGAIAGMSLMSAVIGLPLRLAAERLRHGMRLLEGLAGAGSVAVGVALALGA
jgi:ABC-type nickel/cobalt efflux system permease component RcnA